jgi:3-hydroxyacyl-[acyl-carrier-protein] dehydratase
VRFLFVDNILELERDKRILATKSFTVMDTFLTAHYPRCPAVPASLLIECLAQAGGWLNLISREFAVKTLLVLVEGVRIYRQAKLGETLLLDVQTLYAHPDGMTVRGTARVGTEVVVVAERILLAHEVTPDPAFKAERLNHLRYLNKDLVPPQELST